MTVRGWGLGTHGGCLSPHPAGLGERASGPLSCPGSASYSQDVQRFSTGGDTAPPGGVWKSLRIQFWLLSVLVWVQSGGKAHSSGNRES